MVICIYSQISKGQRKKCYRKKPTGVTYCQDEIGPVSLTHTPSFYLGGCLFNSTTSTSEHLKVTLQINYFVHLSLTTHITCLTRVVPYFLFIRNISSLGLITNQSIVQSLIRKQFLRFQPNVWCFGRIIILSQRLIPMLPST